MVSQCSKLSGHSNGSSSPARFDPWLLAAFSFPFTSLLITSMNNMHLLTYVHPLPVGDPSSGRSWRCNVSS